MKNAIIGFFSIVLLLLAGFAISTSEGKAMRQNELSSTLSASMEKSMEILTMSKDYDIEDQKEFAADFIQNAMIKMNSESKYEVEVFTIDTEKGMLDAQVTETYQRFLSPGKVTVRRTIVLDDYTNPEEDYFTVTFKTKAGDIVKQINIHGGDFLSKSLLPTELKTKTFKCEETGTTHSADNMESIAVIRDLTFVSTT